MIVHTLIILKLCHVILYHIYIYLYSAHETQRCCSLAPHSAAEVTTEQRAMDRRCSQRSRSHTRTHILITQAQEGPLASLVLCHLRHRSNTTECPECRFCDGTDIRNERERYRCARSDSPMYGSFAPSFDAQVIIIVNASPHWASGSICAISTNDCRSWHSAVATTVQHVYG